MLALEKLSLAYGPDVAVRDVDLALAPGETLGLIGESGSGKSTLVLGILRLLPENGRVVAGRISLGVDSLLELPSRDLRRMRWKAFAYVPQGAMNAFDPVRTLRAQFEVTARAHGEKGNIAERARSLFAQVGLDPAWLDRFPHQFSGGMRQRAAIALALLFEPRLLIADEPTTGLDVIVQAEIVELLRSLCAKRGLALMLVSHDLGVVASLCDRIAVMYAGSIVEEGPAATILHRPRHPYSMALRLAYIELLAPPRPLISIAGTPPMPRPDFQGCAFAARCPFAIERCRDEAPKLHGDPAHRVACHRADEADALRIAAEDPALWERP